MRGFTLVEVLITLFILTIVGILISSGLHTVLEAQERIQAKYKTLSTLQQGITLIERDLQQVMSQPPMILSDNKITFTRSGFMYSGQSKKITYQLIGKNLVRMSQDVVNTVTQKQITTQIVLRNINAFHVQLVPATNNPLNSTTTQPIQNGNLKLGMAIDIDIAGLGSLNRLIAFTINTVEDSSHAPF